MVIAIREDESPYPWGKFFVGRNKLLIKNAPLAKQQVAWRQGDAGGHRMQVGESISLHTSGVGGGEGAGVIEKDEFDQSAGDRKKAPYCLDGRVKAVCQACSR